MITTQRINDTMKSSNSSPMLPNDVLTSILSRSDPSCIFNGILVCKEWLRIITEPDFRQHYLKIWAGHPKLLVGFLTYPYHYRHQQYYDHRRSDPLTITLVATSKLGRTIKADLELMKKLPDYYIISKSSLTDGFFLFGAFPDSLSAYKPFAAAAHDLPPPPVNYEDVAVAIVTEDSDQFKVIVARSDNKTLDIQTFSSSTRTWEQSKIACKRNTSLEGPGLVSSTGVAYWPMSDYNLQAYDSKNRSIGLVLGPKHKVGYSSYPVKDVYHCYGVSPQGSICCATHAYSTTLASSWIAGSIQVWVLDENDEDEEEQQRWKFMYGVNLESVWAKHSSVLEPVFDGKPSVPFFFVSFVPGRMDCLYLELEKVLFVYHVDTQDLDMICPKVYHDLYDNYKRQEVYYDYKTAPNGFDHPGNRKYALSLEELGMWPVSSPILHL